MIKIRKQLNEKKRNLVLGYIDDFCKKNLVTRREFMSSRERDVMYQRHSLIYWLVANTTLTSTEIGDVFIKDRSTINHSCESMLEAFRLNELGLKSELFDTCELVCHRLNLMSDEIKIEQC